MHRQHHIDLVRQPKVLHPERHPHHGAQKSQGEQPTHRAHHVQLHDLAPAAPFWVPVVAEELQHQGRLPRQQHEVAVGLRAVHLEVGRLVGHELSDLRGREVEEPVAVEGAGGAEEAEEEGDEPEEGPAGAVGEDEDEGAELGGADGEEDAEGGSAGGF